MTGDRRVLHHSTVGAAEARLWFLHGIYGAGRNWGSVARALVRRRPSWGGLLVDLRLHGGSRGFAAPHTLEACVGDLEALARHRGEGPAAILGHSFGGKVALLYARDAAPGLRQAWVVDSTPSARPPGGSAWEMLRAVRELPARFEDRAAAVEALEDRGFEELVARWMTTNLEEREEGLAWRFDPEEMEALLRDFFRTDLWEVVDAPPEGVTLHVVKAEGSRVLPEEECRRIEALAGAGRRVRLHRVEGGHWLNADNPDALLELLASHLP